MSEPETRTEGDSPAAQFDSSWYLEAHPEAANARNPERHFRTVGVARDFRPNPYFSESFYRHQYPDVEAAVASGEFETGFDHYVLVGQHEGRLPCPLFIDDAWYRAEYPEAAAAISCGEATNCIDHYLRIGAARGYSPHAAFDEEWYLDCHEEVVAAVETGRYLCGYQHFLESGLEAGYSPHPLYSDDAYLGHNVDLEKEATEGRLSQPYLHLISLGLAEGREWRNATPDQEVRRAATEVALHRLEQFFVSGRSLILPRTHDPEVSILIVLYNRAELTLQCLEALRLVEDVSFEVVLVDNDSEDETRRLLRRVEGARIVLNDENEGFLLACNRAAALARGRHLLFLNNDTELWPASLKAAVDCLDECDGAGAVGGRLINLDGRLQEAGSLVWSDGTTEGYGRGDDPSSGAYRFRREVDYCSGAFLLTLRDLFEELGGFDETFTPAYYEESDYCFRLREAGHRVIYEPNCVLLHHECASLKEPAAVNHHLARNRPLFVERHREALAEAQDKDLANMFLAGDRRRHRGRILILEDRVPLQKEGSGFPRCQEIVHILCELGYFVTLFATDPRPVDWAEVRREMPEDNLELINHLARAGFEDFWRRRRQSYDVLIVSRPHNMAELLKSGFSPGEERPRLIYDGEAVFARRQQRRREVLGDVRPVKGELSFEEELQVARVADEIWAVSAEEGRLLAGPGQHWSVIAHGTPVEAGPRTFEDRRGVLFVGRMIEEWNPNVDALRWYLSEIHPTVLEELGDEGRLTVVGKVGDFEMPECEGVEYLGQVDDLAPIYDRHRLFVAPTRFAAGIPHKVTAAAAHGLPVVLTSLLADQLGWSDGEEVAAAGENDAERFAQRVLDVYRGRDLWQTLRANALQRAARDHGPEAMRAALVASLQSVAPTVCPSQQD